MKTLEDYTPEIKAKVNAYKEKCTKDLYSGVEYEKYDRNLVVTYVEKVYELAKRKKPVVIVANDPIDYANKFRAIQNEKVLDLIHNMYLKKNGEECVDVTEEELMNTLKDVKIDVSINVNSHFLFICSSYHRVYTMWYKFIQDEFNIDHKNKEILNWLYENSNNNISRCYFTAMYVLVLRMPKYIRRNSLGFHNIDGYAIEWENYGMYYVNGRKLSNKIFEDVVNKKYTIKEFLKETNEDVKASIITLIIEKFGNQELMNFLDAKIVDEKTISHSSGHSEIVKLWKTNEVFSFLSDINGNLDQPYAWLELKCPTSGSIYLIPTSPHFIDAVECCKFHRPQQVPSELRYDFDSFNN